MGVVPPPNTQTVKKTMSSVVVNIICRAYVAVSRMAKANAIAPRKPAQHHIQHSSRHSQSAAMTTINNNGCYVFTCKHHHVLEVPLDFVPSAKVE